MILYINGDSHSAGAEAVNDYAFARDDSKFFNYPDKWAAHPDNLAVCYGKVLADAIGYEMVNQSRSAGSNDRTIRTTLEYLQDQKPDIIVIGWTTWEREEWFVENDWWQVNSSGLSSDWPEEVKNRYKKYVAEMNWNNKAFDAHDKIWNFHNQLLNLQIPHLFFNAWGTFNYYNEIPKYDWGDCYIRPYDNWSYWHYLTNLGYSKSEWNHFRADGHAKWAEFLLPYLTKLL